MKILVTGCKGQLGIELIRQLSDLKDKYDLIETDTNNLDITKRDEVENLFNLNKPELVINCAAYTNVDACETDELNAYRVNALGAQNLAFSSNKIGGRIVHISTDYVFDGSGDKRKREDDYTNPQTCYGRSKAYGEKLVREANPNHYILRTAWLYGEGNNFVRTMLKLAKEKANINVVNDQLGCPTSTYELVKCIIDLIKTDYFGTFHATCEGECSWYEFAKRIFEFSNLEVEVNPVASEQFIRPAKRPKYSVLENFMLKLVNLNCFENWEQALLRYIKEGENS